MVGWLVEHRCRFISYYNGKIVVVVMTAVMVSVDITITTIILARTPVKNFKDRLPLATIIEVWRPCSL